MEVGDTENIFMKLFKLNLCSKYRKKIEFLTLTTNEAGAKISKLTKDAQELTNEMILVKGITVTNSPELREANKKIKELRQEIEDLTNPVQKARESGL